MIVLMSMIFRVGYDGPELLDIENAALNPIDTMTGASDTGMSGSHKRSLLVQQRQPVSNGDDDDDDDDDDGDTGSADCADRGDGIVDMDDGNVAAVRPGN